MLNETVVNSFLEIELPERENFLKVKETLTRIGVASKKDNTLYQSCHILHKRGKYYLVHFKELFKLDGKDTTFSEEDKARRNTIANLLEEWDLINILNKENANDPIAPLSHIKVLSHRDKDQWNLVTKYNIGNKR